jgi:hypothetical protein
MVPCSERSLLTQTFPPLSVSLNNIGSGVHSLSSSLTTVGTSLHPEDCGTCYCNCPGPDGVPDGHWPLPEQPTQQVDQQPINRYDLLMMVEVSGVLRIVQGML